MAQELSREAKFKYNDNTVGDITSLSISIDGNVIENNSFDTGIITQALSGRKTITFSISGNLDRSDTDGQNQIRTDFLNANYSAPSDYSGWGIEPETPTAGDTIFSGAGFPTSYEESRGDEGDGLSTYSLEWRATSFTESTQT